MNLRLKQFKNLLEEALSRGDDDALATLLHDIHLEFPEQNPVDQIEFSFARDLIRERSTNPN